MQQDKPLRRLGYHSGACKGLLARSPARRQTLPSDQPPLPAGLPRPRLHVTTRYVCQDPPIDAPSPSLRLAASAGNPLADAVSERKPDGQSHRKIEYQVTHRHRPGNDHQIVSALNNGKM